jgi:hypothetical protein
MNDPECKLCSVFGCVHGEQSPSDEDMRISKLELELSIMRGKLQELQQENWTLGDYIDDLGRDLTEAEKVITESDW